jgi:hypothetical protein
MSKIDANLVRRLMENGRAKDLADLMEGESKYWSKRKENLPTTKEDAHICRMALEHVLFVSKFGSNFNKGKEGSHFYSAYPEYFERWLDSGCLGIAESDLMAYLTDYPLN